MKRANNDDTSASSVLKVKRTRKTVPRDSPPKRSSIYRGVTRHRWTGRYEAHLWDKNCWNESQNKKGRQVEHFDLRFKFPRTKRFLYLGAYDDEEAAAHAYDLAALKYWGPETILNFPLPTYQNELVEMESQSREEYIGSLRRKSSGFSRGVSKFRGVARHHHNGRWEARIGRVFGNKYLYLGTYATQEEAAVAYDMAAIEYRGLNAVTNFDLSRYIKWLRPSNNNTNQSNDVVESNPVDPNPNPESGLNIYNQTQPSMINDDIVPSQSRPDTAMSALGLLLQSSKFKEMMEMTTTNEIPSTSQESDPPQSSFPEEIRPNFGSQDYGYYGEGGDEFFQDLGSFIFDA